MIHTWYILVRTSTTFEFELVVPLQRFQPFILCNTSTRISTNCNTNCTIHLMKESCSAAGVALEMACKDLNHSDVLYVPKVCVSHLLTFQSSSDDRDLVGGPMFCVSTLTISLRKKSPIRKQTYPDKSEDIIISAVVVLESVWNTPLLKSNPGHYLGFFTRRSVRLHARYLCAVCAYFLPVFVLAFVRVLPWEHSAFTAVFIARGCCSRRTRRDTYSRGQSHYLKGRYIYEHSDKILPSVSQGRHCYRQGNLQVENMLPSYI